MKINPVNPGNMINNYERVQKSSQENKITSTNRDRVDISKDYAVYEKALKALKETTDIEKLDRLKDKIAKGEYNITSRELADAIINKVKESGKDPQI